MLKIENIKNIPKELKELPRWLCWGAGKIPYQPKSPGQRADVTNSNHWATFEEAFSSATKSGYGIGIAMSEEEVDGKYLVGIDFDKCLDNEEVLNSLTLLCTYVETSPSGQGYRAFVWVTKEQLSDICRKGKVEIYSKDRYLTITGEVVTDISYPLVGVANGAYTALREHWRLVPSLPVPAPPPVEQISSCPSGALLEKIRSSKNGEEFDALYSGENLHHISSSEADLHFFNILSFWTARNYQQMKDIAFQSQRVRKKWQRRDYIPNLINKAISDTTDIYTPPPQILYNTDITKNTVDVEFKEVKTVEVDWEEVQSQVIQIIKESRIVPIKSKILKRLLVEYDRNIPMSTLNRKVFKPLEEQKLIFKLDPNSRKSAYCLEEPLIEGSELIVGEDIEEVQTYVPLLPLWNDKLAGGIARGEIILINQLTGAGKSYMYLTAAVRAINNHNLKVKYIDLELGKHDVNRYLSHILGSRLEDSRMSDPEWFSYQDMGTKVITKAYLEEVCKKYDVIIIDYLKFDKFSSGLEASKTGTAKGSAIMQEIQTLIKQYNNFFISGTQVIDVDGKPSNPTIRLRGGDSWKEPASVEICVFDLEHEEGEIYLKALVTKCRGGGGKGRVLKPGRVLEYKINAASTEYSDLPLGR